MKAIPKITHVLIFTETWIKSESDAKLYEIPNYTHIYNYRPFCGGGTKNKQRKKKNKCRGGGVSIYVHDSIKHEVTEELFENGNHYLWLYIDKLSLNIGAVYKPGDTNLQNFLDLYSPQLERRKRAVVFGDFNIDLLSKESHVSQYLQEIQGNGYEVVNKIDKMYSTRQTSTTNTLLDHVCSNIINHSFSISIIESSLSDHKQIYLEIGSLAPLINAKLHYKALDYEELYNSRKMTTTA